MKQNNNFFVQRLKNMLPLWIAQGWIDPKYQENIINSAIESEKKEPHDTPSIFAFMGILLISVSLITFFAANWQEFNKITKLFILFGLLFGCYILAGYLKIAKKESSYWLKISDFLLLLGVIIFGVNIWQIAIIYHIDAHFPNGILLWSLGSFLVALLLKNEFCMILAIFLALLWSLTESIAFLQSIHWSFLIIFCAYLLVILKNKWQVAFHILMLCLMLWLTSNLFWLKTYDPLMQNVLVSNISFAIGVYILSSLILLVLGSFWQQKNRHPFAKTLQHYAFFFLFLNFYYLTFPDFLKYFGLPEFSLIWVTISLAVIACTSVVIIFNAYKQSLPKKIFTLVLFACIGVMLMLNHFVAHFSLMAIAYNILMLGLILWGVVIGYTFGDRVFINIAFLFFAFWIIARYFDVFWGLLDRSLFFALGGLALLLGSIYLERKRKFLTKSMQDINNANNYPQYPNGRR